MEKHKAAEREHTYLTHTAVGQLFNVSTSLLLMTTNLRLDLIIHHTEA